MAGRAPKGAEGKVAMNTDADLEGAPDDVEIPGRKQGAMTGARLIGRARDRSNARTPAVAAAAKVLLWS
jgi:hypothetical protein